MNPACTPAGTAGAKSWPKANAVALREALEQAASE